MQPSSMPHQSEPLMRPSTLPPPNPRAWLQRTFAPLSPGGVRGNVLLLTITTMGSSFFYLPYIAKHIGIVATFFLLIVSATVSYLSSTILYMGFKHSAASTYDECFKFILGPTLGFISNLVVFVHLFVGIVGSWIFSYTFVSSSLLEIMQGAVPDPSLVSAVKYAYFATTFCLLFIVTLSRSVEKLKSISMVGIVLLIYLVTCFVYLTSDYFAYYDKQELIKFQEIIWTPYMLKAYGIIQALFLNQYTILPICHNVVYTNQKRIRKILQRSIILLFSIYTILLIAGYFSEPYNTTTEIFLQRMPIPGVSDNLILYGRLGFGITLFIAMLVKSCYLLLYFDQLLLKFVGAPELTAPPLEEQQDLKRDSYVFPPIESSQVKDPSPQLPPVIISASDQNSPNHKTPLSVNIMAKNFVFFVLILLMVTYFMDKLSKLVSMVGSFVGAFEITILPGQFISIYVFEDQRKWAIHIKEK